MDEKREIFGNGSDEDISDDDGLSLLPRYTKVVVTGNNRTKTALVGLHGVVKKAVVSNRQSRSTYYTTVEGKAVESIYLFVFGLFLSVCLLVGLERCWGFHTLSGTFSKDQERIA